MQIVIVRVLFIFWLGVGVFLAYNSPDILEMFAVIFGGDGVTPSVIFSVLYVFLGIAIAYTDNTSRE
jgi:hypothetical protein